MSSTSRRSFLATSLATSLTTTALASAADAQTGGASGGGSGKRPVIISARNGFPYHDRAFEALKNGADTLDAGMRVVTGPEDDPNDTSVGLGGLPNEEGVVELDSCCMHGPTRRAGSVGGVRNIKNVSLVAKAVMEHTGHVMLCGEGAERFAVSMGFPRENLLTDHSRKVWTLWREAHSNQDWWGPQVGAPNWTPPDTAAAQPTASRQTRVERLVAMAADLGIEENLRLDAVHKVLYPPTGTIHCSVCNEKGEVSGVTTTSGLSWKIPGRIGDSAIIGAGCYTDPDVGSAGATGSGEENIKVAGAHTIVENMRKGMSPHDAGMDALKRIAHIHREDKNQLRFIGMIYYILRKDGAYAGVSLWSGPANDRKKFAVHDGTKRLEECAYLFEGDATDWPPSPKLDM
jgi:N4-(beta-N-acetylglucosaminyl)-L-asparaginase